MISCVFFSPGHAFFLIFTLVYLQHFAQFCFISYQFWLFLFYLAAVAVAVAIAIAVAIAVVILAWDISVLSRQASSFSDNFFLIQCFVIRWLCIRNCLYKFCMCDSYQTREKSEKRNGNQIWYNFMEYYKQRKKKPPVGFFSILFIRWWRFDSLQLLSILTIFISSPFYVEWICIRLATEQFY